MASLLTELWLVVVLVACVTSVPVKLTGRIVGGSVAQDAQFPYFASLIAYDGGQSLCGGAIISEWFVLTAAHCVIDYHDSADELFVAPGVRRLDVEIFVHSVHKITIHADYNEDLYTDDIALIKTLEQMEFSQNVQPIALAQSDVGDDQTATLCGLGIINYSLEGEEIFPDVLQYQDTTIMSKQKCRKAFHNYQFESDEDWRRVMNLLIGKTFCTSNEFAKGPCHGDSGGPLVVNNTLVGLVSTSIGCAYGYPDIYVSIFEQREWIDSAIQHTLSGNNV